MGNQAEECGEKWTERNIFVVKIASDSEALLGGLGSSISLDSFIKEEIFATMCLITILLER